MKLLFDFLPVILFFGMFKYAEARPDWAAATATDWLGFMVSGGVVGPKEAPVLLATVVVILATAAQIAWLVARRRKVDTMLWVSLALVTVIMGAAFWISQAVFGKNLLQALMGSQLELPAAVWQRLNVAWIAFFALMGLLNIYVAYTFSTATWVNFKLFGGLGLMLAFMVAQGVYLSRHLKNEEQS
jgi:intracellular septation protein